MDIFGHAAVLLFPGEFARALEREPFYRVITIVLGRDLIRVMGEEIFGIDESTARDLAVADPEEFSLERPPRISDAVAVLHHLAETGKVDWSVAPNAGPFQGEKA